MKTYIDIMKIELDKEQFYYISIEGMARAGISPLVHIYKCIKHKLYKPIVKKCYSYPKVLYFCLQSRERFSVLK